MFQDFMGYPSISEGLSLPGQKSAWTERSMVIPRRSVENKVLRVVVHVTLFRDEFHGPLDLHVVSKARPPSCIPLSTILYVQ